MEGIAQQFLHPRLLDPRELQIMMDQKNKYILLKDILMMLCKNRNLSVVFLFLAVRHHEISSDNDNGKSNKKRYVKDIEQTIPSENALSMLCIEKILDIYRLFSKNSI